MTTRSDVLFLRHRRAGDPQISALVRAHRDSHHVHYGTDLLTDHGPMASLALAGLGAPADIVARYAALYARRLQPQQKRHGAIDKNNYSSALGHIEAYAALLGFFDREIVDRGSAATLHRYLPDLISGWVHDAYHATIRLGYGIEFAIDSEIAAGLAYFAALGPDPALAAQSENQGYADDPLDDAHALYNPSFGAGAFADRYRAVLRSGAVQRVMPDLTDALGRASRAALGVFDRTHGFFALHLVTGSHAMRVCSPFAGPAAGRLLWAGVIAGYLCIGAPQPAPFRRVVADLALRDPEHLIKLAYTARSQAAAFDDPSYIEVADRYLDGTNPVPDL